MDMVYEKNINRIRSNNIALYNRIKDHIATMDIQMLPAKDNNKYMQVKVDDNIYNINSKYRPLHEAFKWIEGLDIKDNSKIILLGLGSGYRISHILKKITSNNKLLIIEPSLDIFIETIKNFDLTNLFSNNNVILLINEKEDIVKKNVGKFIGWRNVKQVVVGMIPNYNNIFYDLCNRYTEIIKEQIGIQLINYDTGQGLAKAWYKNFILNTTSILNSYKVNDLQKKFENMPVVIVSAGPSLNKNVKLLNKIKDKALIICVGTAFKVLKKEGIKPHIIVTLDGSIENYYHFEGLDYNDILLIYLPIVYPQILREHMGKKVVSINSLPYLGEELFDVLGDVEELNVGGSVAHMALSLAQKLDANPIVFIGQDLAYGKEKQTHAKGTSFDEGKVEHRADKFDQNLLVVKDINDKDVLTDKVLFSFLRWFERKIEEDISERVYIDATEGGAKIIGTKIMTLQKVIDIYMKNDLTQEIKKVVELSGSKRICEKCNTELIIDDLKCILKKIKVLSEELIKGLKIIDKLKDAYSNGIVLEDESQDIKNINEISKSFTTDIDSSRFLSYVLYYTTYKMDEFDFNEIGLSPREKKYRVVAKQEFFFQTTKDVITELIIVIEDCINELKQFN
ncbi:6-hydroxymethylpterin diphosphokinase MptE-like protein [Wukongibacter baidiensis]|uniref:motility associated factor glycosyltransferase family protein n=1 Tax=Wukongibacter baidiensis TaxID=1723361 RepID=UPI003D7FAE5E